MSAEGSQSAINIREEVTWGTVDSGQFTGVNFSSEDLAFNIENNTSKHIRPDRQTAELVQVAAECSGGFESEFQATNLDSLLPGFLYDTAWVSPGTLANPVNFAVEGVPGDGGTITFDVGDTINIVVGQYIKLTGATDPANVGVFRVKAVAGQVVTVFSPLVTEGPVSVVLSGDRIRNGVVRSSFSIEREHSDVSQFFLYNGMVPNTMEFSLESGSPVGVKLGFVGKDEELDQTTHSTGSPTALPTKPIYNAGTSVGEVSVDDTALAACLLQKVDFVLDNQAEGKTGVGTLGFCDVDAKSISLTGNISLYFQDETYYDKYLAATSFSLAFVFTDPLGNTYVIQLPKCKFDAATANVTDMDDSVILEATFVAIVGADGFTIEIMRSLIP